MNLLKIKWTCPVCRCQTATQRHADICRAREKDQQRINGAETTLIKTDSSVYAGEDRLLNKWTGYILCWQTPSRYHINQYSNIELSLLHKEPHLTHLNRLSYCLVPVQGANDIWSYIQSVTNYKLENANSISHWLKWLSALCAHGGLDWE